MIDSPLSLLSNLEEMECTREAYWLQFPKTSPVKLRWRALTVRHCFHLLPGESILELGAGSGLWTEHLVRATSGENQITAAVFHDDLATRLRARQLTSVTVIDGADLLGSVPPESFDYIVGTAILCHDLYAENLHSLYQLLKPGGQILFFEANYWNPQVFLKSTIPVFAQWAGNARCQMGMRKFQLMHVASHQGFTHVETIPYDIVHGRTPRFLIDWIRGIAFILEQTPLLREFCGTLYIWARKPGQARRPSISLAKHAALFDSTSIVVPCHNEEMNVGPLVAVLTQFYDPYIHEILLVNDNSKDRTAEGVRALSVRYPKVKLVDRRPPNGVGRALRDGYAAASGDLILTMDCDFVHIVPEFRDLFDVIAEGHAGAIGSRFTHESVLINYPLAKILVNRGFHLLLNMLLRLRVRDVSNNLKLMRSGIYKTLTIDEDHFAANVETGLKPILAGYDIREVPISWINRTVDMGHSSFRIVRMAPNYARALWRILKNARAIRGSAGTAPVPRSVEPARPHE